MKQNQNSRRINEEAREKLAQILLFEVADPDLVLVTLTGVEVSLDKSILRAYVSCDPERYEDVFAALGRARGRIRSLLGGALGWRVTPELIWQIDTTEDDAERIARALMDIPPTMGIEKDEEGYPVMSPTDVPVPSPEPSLTPSPEPFTVSFAEPFPDPSVEPTEGE